MSLPPNIKELFLASVQYKTLFSQPSGVITSLFLQNPVQDTFAFQSHYLQGASYLQASDSA